MNRNLLLGLGRFLMPIPRPIWTRQVTKDEQGIQSGALDFMTADHHRVRDLTVLELPRQGRPLPPDWIARQLSLPLEQVQTILDELEQHMTFLFRNPQGEVTWAYPVTVDKTPHRVTFSSGESVYAA